MQAAKELKELIDQLPPELQQEVRDFVEFLLERRARKRGRKLRQDWAGALRDYRDRYTSLELQEKALEWRGDGPMYLVPGSGYPVAGTRYPVPD
jgi:hypothetical protein